MAPWMLGRRTLLAQLAALLASIAADAGQLRRVAAQSGGSTPNRLVKPGSLRLGYSESEISTIRRRLQTPAASGGDKELFVAWITTLNTEFNPADIVGTNYYGVDAGLWAMGAADLYMLNPEEASWASAGITFGSRINTRAKCWSIADSLIRLSTFHDAANRTGLTCLSRLTAGATARLYEGSDAHPWYLTPVMMGVPVWYVWERIRAELDPAASDQYVTAMLTWVEGHRASLIAHAYPDMSASPKGRPTQTIQVTNNANSMLSHLGMGGARVLLGTGVIDASQEADIEKAFLNCYVNRMGAEYAGLFAYEGIANASMNEATCVGNGYAADNALAAARMALLLWPSAAFRSAHPQRAWFESLPESILKGVLPGVNFSSPIEMGYAYMMGTAELYQKIANSGEWLYLCAAACSKMGLTTQARQLKWLALTCTPTTAISGSVAVPTAMNSAAYRGTWPWYLIMGGGLSGLTSLPITAFTTRKGPLGTRIDNDLFDNPRRGTFTMFYPMVKNFGTSRPATTVYAGSTQIWTRGSWVRMRHVGGNKGPFGADCGLWFLATCSRPGFFKLRSPAWTSAARGFIDGYPANDYADDDMASLSNAGSFKRIGHLYADDPDHPTGFYAGYEALWEGTRAERQQHMAISLNDKDLFIEFLRATPVTGYAPSFAWASPVRLTYHNGTETIPDHYLMPGTPAKGAWLSDDADTFVGVNRRAAFTASHKNDDLDWPAADAKWFTTVLSAAGMKDWRMEYRGYDPTFTPGGLRDNLELQNGDSDYGRNAKCAWQGTGAVTNGTTTIALSDNPQALPHPIRRIALGVSPGAAPILRTGTYDHSAHTFTVTGAALAAARYNYSLMESDPTEMYFDLDGDREEVMTVCGHGSARILGLTDRKVDWCVVTKLGAASDGAFTAPPTYTRFVESDVWGVHIATDNVAAVVAVAHVLPTGPTAWLAGYDFLLPTTATTQVHCCDLRPGTYNIARATEGGTNTRVTLTASGGGSFTVGASGRIVVSVATGGVTLASR